MEDKAELESLIRSLLVSAPNVLKANRLEQDFYDTEGRRFPFRTLGFSSFLDYLKSIPNVVQLVPFNSSNPDVLPIVTNKISHIDILVSKQRNTSSSSRKRRSRGSFGARSNFNPPPRRLPSPSNHHQPQLRSTPNKGVYVSDIENHIQSKYSREILRNNGIHSAHNLLSNAKGMVDFVKDKVFPKFSNYPEMVSPTSLQPQKNLANCIPAGMEDEFEDRFVEEDSNKYGNDYDINYDSVFDDIDEEVVSNYTIQRCTESLLNSKRSVESHKGYEKNVEFTEELSYDDHEGNFSDRMIRNFRSILAKHPEGVWATELPQKYLKECKVTLDIQALGYTSAVEMASYLPNVFVYKRVGSHDWKLFDALLYKDETYKLPSNVDEINLKGNFGKNYVPKSILENISLLLDRYKQGIKSTDLINVYEREFNKKLDLDTLGFKVFEDFLEILKDVITVRKASGHYFLLPKHKTLSLDEIETNQFEELKLPIEPFEFVGPEDVLKPNDVIPPQELPPVNVKNPLEPLMSLIVRVGEVKNPCLFYMMLDSKYNELESMMDDLHNFYQQEEHNYKIILPYLSERLVCACKYEGLWHRAVITAIRRNQMVDIEYIDYGSPGNVHVSELRFLQSDFAKLPSQAICAKLIGLVPKSENKKWSEESCRMFLNLITERRIVADVYRINTKKNKEERVQLEVILYDTNNNKEVVLNEYLVEKGFAHYINSEQENKEVEINEKQSDPSTNKSQQSPAIQTDEMKWPPRIPPGFETTYSSGQVQNQDIWSPNVGSQVYTQTPVQQHWQINNILVAPQESNLRQLQSLIQNPHLFNMQYQGNQSNSIWPQIPQIPFMQSNPNYMSNALPNPVQNIYFPPLNYFPPAYVNPAQVKPNFFNNTQNIHYQNKVPGYSGDLSMPLNLVPQQNDSPGSYQQRTPVPDLTTPAPMGINNDLMKRPNLQKTPPIPDLLHKYDKPQPSEYMNKSIPFDKEVNKDIGTLDDIKINTDILSPKNINGSELTNCASLNVIPSAVDLNYSKIITQISEELKSVTLVNEEYKPVIDLNETKKITQLSEDLKSGTLVNEEYKSVDVPEKWEDIEPDDTPARADSFEQNFKASPYSVGSLDKRNTTSNKIPYVHLSVKSEKITSGNDLLQSNLIQKTKNWKDIFDPDNFSNPERNNTLNTINSQSEKKSLEKKLIKKLEFKDKFFHLLQVNNKSAVLAEEFFPQFVQKVKWQVINKLVESKYKPFVTVCKKDNPALFSEFETIEPCGGINKKWYLKLGKVYISYISDIPSVFSVLNKTPEPELLNKLKIYENISTST